jgi:hypothetical protein
MASLPPTATSWDITTWSPAQRLRASRALIRNEAGRTAHPVVAGGQQLTHPGLAPLAAPGPPVGRPTELVTAGMPLRQATLDRVESPPAGFGPPGLLPASVQQAPLLSMDPLLPTEATEPGSSGSDSPPEGVRVRTAIGQRYGVDLTNVPLDRSREAATEAHRIGARAFTSDRAIVVPAEAGSLETGMGEALFAHELTHVAQRARLGPDRPAESSQAGRFLEAEALSTELSLAPLGSTPSLAGRPSESGVGAGSAASRTTGAGLPLAATAAGPDVESLTASVLERMSALAGPPAVGQPTEVFSAPWASSPAPAPAPSGGDVQRAEEFARPLFGSATAPATAQQVQESPFTRRPSDQELTNLSRWLYPLIKYRLKGELREDRERAGLLTDHYRRW